jgi:N-acetylneuraminic acid mutarotase
MARFRMIGKDENASPAQYRCWVVDDEPDFTGAQYTGLKSGDNPLLDIRTYEVIDPNAVCDFLLPDPSNWISTKRVLPQVISNSQLAILDGYDGYAYLFGGQNSDKIYRASPNNPADWFDTGATLPTKLSDSQLAVVNDRIYLFGGFDDGYAGSPTDEIFSAPTSNPLAWTNHGSLLPQKLSRSQLLIIDSNIYLLGGMGISGSTNVILRASTTTPLSWMDTGQKLPHKLFNSQACISEFDGYSDGYLLLLGGQFDGYTLTNNIYYAPISNPISWAIGGNLPAQAAAGQFVQVAGKGYLLTPANIGVSFTRIFQCDLTKPFSWTDHKFTIPGQISYSQAAIIADRLWLFGGSGSSVIFADEQILKYDLVSATVVKYGDITRTQVDAADPLDLFQVLGMPPWKTDYKT